MPSKLGVTIGLEYTSSSVSSLQGTINDSINIGRLLSQKYGYNITNLNDRSYPPTSSYYPSKANIIAWITKLLNEAQDGDELFIGYAGHGVQLQISTANSEEIDFRDEAIIPADYKFTDSTAITDDEIQRLLDMYLVSKPNCKVFMLFDCCHSGTIADLRYTYNYRNSSGSFVSSDSGKSNPFGSKVILVSGCRDEQVSWGDLISLDGTPKTQQGVMTSAFIHVVSRDPTKLLNVFSIIKEMYQYTSPYNQQPQISCNYDISLDTNRDLRSVIDYRSSIASSTSFTNTSLVNTSSVNTSSVNTSSVNTSSVNTSAGTSILSSIVKISTKPTSTTTTTQKPQFAPNVTTTRPTYTLSSLLSMYSSTNRYRYRFTYLNRSRYNSRYRYVNSFTFRSVGSKDVVQNLTTNKVGVSYRTSASRKTKIVSMSDILGMVV